MIISIDNLKAGLEWWRDPDRDRRWPQDILNAEYHKMYTARSESPTGDWWNATVDRLGEWRAYRGPKPPNTKAEISARGKQHLTDIASQFAKLNGRSSGAEPSIADLCWEDVAPLFEIASDIKPGSPVFAGKMCHFLFPKLFVVMDNLATGVSEYELYWRGMRDAWNRFERKADARNLLKEAIVESKSKDPLHLDYPFETKIMELSHIGHKHARQAKQD